MFKVLHLDLPANPFDELLEATSNLEALGVGRQCGVIVAPRRDGALPLVRTTSVYSKPPCAFQPIHCDLVDRLGLPFNNGLVEVYDDAYKSMGFHSDQAQDLADGSHIAVCSFYKKPEAGGLRRLIVKPKSGVHTAGGDAAGHERPKAHERLKGHETIDMTHGSVIVFPLDVNARHLHKIVLSQAQGNTWLGVTLRLSKEFVAFVDGSPSLTSCKGLHPLRLASHDERLEFYKTRSKENKSIGFIWPSLDYTISPSDLVGLD